MVCVASKMARPLENFESLQEYPSQKLQTISPDANSSCYHNQDPAGTSGAIRRTHHPMDDDFAGAAATPVGREEPTFAS